MSDVVISVEDVSKCYRLGAIGTRTLSGDFECWWARVRGKPDPLLKVGQQDQDNGARREVLDELVRRIVVHRRDRRSRPYVHTFSGRVGATNVE